MSSPVSLGDLSTAFLQRAQNVQLRSAIDRQTLELSTGVASNLSQKLGGNYGPLVQINNALEVNAAYMTVTTELRLQADAKQNALDAIQTKVGDFALTAQTASGLGGPNSVSGAATDARNYLEDIFETLNTRVGEVSLFSGTASDQPAVAPTADLYASLDVAVTGLTDPADITLAIETWMNDPAGYEAVVYGGDQARGAIRVGPTDTVSLEATANDPEIRAVIEGFLVGVYSERVGGLTIDEQKVMMETSAAKLRGAEGSVIDIRAKLGTAQERIEEAQTAGSSEKTSLELAKSALISIDPYEAASQLEASSQQLEMLYTLTSRLSRLSLVEFLR